MGMVVVVGCVKHGDFFLTFFFLVIPVLAWALFYDLCLLGRV